LAGAESLKRLGGGRWASKDGRFTVEPESGTWVLVDNEQTDELGLPLVRGPFPSLTAARAAIDEGRDAGPVASPLAARIERARSEVPSRSTPSATKGSKARPAAASKRTPRPEPAADREPPREPTWLRGLGDDDRRRVRDIVRRLEKAGVADPEAVARAEVADDQPALARLALERRLRTARDAADAAEATEMAIRAVLAGRDDAVGARWRLVDGAGREIRILDPSAGPGDRPVKRRA
jgi:hypothetical protein